MMRKRRSSYWRMLAHGKTTGSYNSLAFEAKCKTLLVLRQSKVFFSFKNNFLIFISHIYALLCFWSPIALCHLPGWLLVYVAATAAGFFCFAKWAYAIHLRSCCCLQPHLLATQRPHLKFSACSSIRLQITHLPQISLQQSLGVLDFFFSAFESHFLCSLE